MAETKFHLVVRSPFDGNEIGARITNPEHVLAILADHREVFVTRIAVPAAEPAKEG